MAADSCWPGQGCDTLWQDLSDACTEQGGEVWLDTRVSRIVIENRRVRGVEIPRARRVMTREAFDVDVIEADCVISTLPVWNVLRVVPEGDLPDWYSAQIRHLAQDRFRVSRLGLYLATDESVYLYDPKGVSTRMRDPVAGLPRFFFTQSNMDGPDDRAGR